MTKAVPDTLSPAANTPGRVAAMVLGLMAMVRWVVTPTPASSGMKARPARWPTEKITVSAAITCSEPGTGSRERRPSGPNPREGAIRVNGHALGFGRLGLLGVAGHSIPRFQAGHLGFRAQPDSRAGAVHRHVAAAQHQDPRSEGQAL